MNDNKENKCGCGRSPSGKCIGWHALSEEKYKEYFNRAEYFTNLIIDFSHGISKKTLLLKKIFNKKKFTIKKKLNSSELKKLLGNNYTNPKVNLDIDFSVSKGGYRLRPHRDDITRLYNFLIYLTDIPKKNGGSLTIYRKKSKKNLRKSFRRFPKIGELEVVKAFTPKKGTVVFFQSTPNSYHGVKRFIEHNCPKRFFIYGSYALNKPVIWNYKGTAYYPHIISTKKRMLTSFHDANYLTTAPKN